jgi:hypothetical protein
VANAACVATWSVAGNKVRNPQKRRATVSTIRSVAAEEASPWLSSGLFWGILVLAFVSVILPPGPARISWFVAAVGLALLVAVCRWLVPWSRISARFKVVPLLLDTAAIACLIFSAGKATGLGSLLLLPLLYSAFYGAPKESLLVIPAITVAQAFLGISNNDTLLVLVRVLIVWISLTTMISLAAHALRGRLQSTADMAREQARQSAVVAAATQALTATLDPDAVARTAARLAADLVSPTARAARRGQYFSLDGDVLTLRAESDDMSMSAVDLVLSAHDHASVRAVLENGQPINGRVDADGSPRRFAPTWSDSRSPTGPMSLYGSPGRSRESSTLPVGESRLRLHCSSA